MWRLLVLSEYRLEYYGGLLLLLFLLLHISIKLFLSFFVSLACYLLPLFSRPRTELLLWIWRRARVNAEKQKWKEYFPFHSFEYLETHFLRTRGVWISHIFRRWVVSLVLLFSEYAFILPPSSGFILSFRKHFFGTEYFMRWIHDGWRSRGGRTGVVESNLHEKVNFSLATTEKVTTAIEWKR